MKQNLSLKPIARKTDAHSYGQVDCESGGQVSDEEATAEKVIETYVHQVAPRLPRSGQQVKGLGFYALDMYKDKV